MDEDEEKEEEETEFVMPFLLIFSDLSMACWRLVSLCYLPWWCRTTMFGAAVVSVSVLPVGAEAAAEAALCDQNSLSCSVECVAPAPGVVLSFIDRIFDIPETSSFNGVAACGWGRWLATSFG